jgi:fluoroacetyl-CoA thioesterase
MDSEPARTAMIEVEDCSPGRRATVELTVTEADTALAMRSGDVPVLASPRVVALAEQAAVLAMGDCLEEGRTTVGAWVELEHSKPTPIGRTVVAEAVLLGVHGRRLEFSVSVREAGQEDEVAHVRHKRVIVSRARFEQL